MWNLHKCLLKLQSDYEFLENILFLNILVRIFSKSDINYSIILQLIPISIYTNNVYLNISVIQPCYTIEIRRL